MNDNALLTVKDLRVSFSAKRGKTVAVKDLSFSLSIGECVALVGESGSGKSVTAMTLLGLTLFNGGQVEQGQITFQRRDGVSVSLLQQSERQWENLRGDQIAMIFQEPMTSLNPLFTVGEQIAEVLRQHRGISNKQAKAQAITLLERVRIPQAETRYAQYPHEISGGMRQRVAIAMALACAPRLLIADEPTTALDVTVQAQILDLIQDIARESQMAVLFITHDMGVVAQVADRVIVMRHGEKVEEQPVASLFSHPQAAYTRQLLDAVPRLGDMRGMASPRGFGEFAPSSKVIQSSLRPLLDVRHLSARFPVHKGLLQRHVANVHAVEDVSFSISAGETLALVGESGSGKSTTGRAVLQLIQAQSGSVELEGQELRTLSGGRLQARRRDMQIIFQDPYAALDPRLRVFDQLAEPLRIHGMVKESELPARLHALLARVELPAEFLTRYPHEMSGGQRQRLCIARALTLAPKIIIADEPVSALDVSIQAQVINLMIELQRDLGLSYLFISHDMAVVERISHRVAVMCRGRIVEIGPRENIFASPQHPYTQALLAAVPEADPARRRTVSPKATQLATPVYPKNHRQEVSHYREVSPGHRVLVNTF
ncbi:glutathione ABC transporter ATP-binding protein GsiA [Rouxiella silvae]|uniref:Glutathione import ATP-binding protein GsiA n=1 Tax=Rouxiella silvae TaxID=1646373 RepID=A0AA40X6P8_9GAMM|nr:ABC transporter ATP-binding protein [Rouxiella silvae]MBF6639242.1 ABC transporter ATP-binding protein [Rouxiella silvae]ORJ23033.1 glutathione ABC transporter ATP-binding protein GsiA [Rouxiella silvae]